jgi:hypothetical protein
MAHSLQNTLIQPNLPLNKIGSFAPTGPYSSFPVMIGFLCATIGRRIQPA